MVVEVSSSYCCPMCIPYNAGPQCLKLRFLHDTVSHTSNPPPRRTRMYHAQLCHASRSAGEWGVAEGVLTALITVCQGNEKICRRLLRAGLDQLIDAAEDSGTDNTSKVTLPPGETAATSMMTPTIKIPGSGSGARSGAASRRGLGTNSGLGLDQMDEIGVDGVLRESAATLAQSMQKEARENCSALATSLLQTLGPFNYVSYRSIGSYC